MLKRIVSAVVLVTMLVCILTSCAAITKITDYFNRTVRSYNKALELIEQGEYQAAYDILKGITDYEPAAEEFKKFHFALTNITEEYTDANGNVTKDISTYFYNECGMLIQEIRAYSEGQYIDEYEYDANGNMTKKVLTQANGNKSTFEYTYDKKGNMTSESYTYNDEETQTTTFTYDKNGKLLTESYKYADGLGESVTEYTYNVNGDVVKKAQKYLYTYEGVTNESAGECIDYTYDANRNLIKEVRTHNSDKEIFDFTYDANGNVIKESYSVVNQSGNIFVYHTYDYTFDANGNNIKTVYTSNSARVVHEYAYDENNNISSAYITNGDYWEMYQVIYAENNNAAKVIYTDSNDNSMTCNIFYDDYNNCTSIVITSGEEIEVYTAQYKLVYNPYETDDDAYEKLLDLLA